MAWDKRVPFTEDGTLVTHVVSDTQGVVAGKSRYHYERFVWKDNFTFEAVLRLDSITRGQSAARFVWADDQEGRMYEMFMKDMLELVQADAVIERGHCDTKWTFVKRGANYGIAAVK